MRTVNIELQIYKFEELPEEIQNKIVNNHINFMIETNRVDKVNKNSNFYKAYKESERMQTPWFFGQYVWEYCKESILKDLNQDEYLEDGAIFTERQAIMTRG